MNYEYDPDDGTIVQVVRCRGCENHVLAGDCGTDSYSGDASTLRCPRCGAPVSPEQIAEFVFESDTAESADVEVRDSRATSRVVKRVVADLEGQYDGGAPTGEVKKCLDMEHGIDEATAAEQIDALRTKGEVYEPQPDHLRTT